MVDLWSYIVLAQSQGSGSGSLVDFIGNDPDRLGVVAILVFVLWAIMSRKLVPGWVLDASERREERYRAIAEKGLGTADRAVSVAENVTKVS